jgi:hypothetical protein
VRKRLPLILSAIASLWCAIVVVTFSDAGVPFPTWLAVSFFGVFLAVVSIIGIAITYTRRRAEASEPSRNLRWFILTTAMIISVFVLAGTSQLLWIRVYLSAKALQQSGPILAGVPPDTLYTQGRWIGLFHVREFAQFGSELRFITNECGIVDNCGIIFSPDGPPPSRGEDSFAHLFGPWWHWYQSF